MEETLRSPRHQSLATPSELEVAQIELEEKEEIRKKLEKVGPEVFKNGKGEPAFHGEINFVGKDTRSPPPFIVTRVPSNDAELQEDARLMAEYMQTTWGLKPPRVLISVTGGAQAFKMRPRLERVFARGLVRSAQNTNAWIVTGGLDSGVMDYVGRAVRMNDADVPTIAVASFQMVTHFDQLQVRGEQVQYKKLVQNSGNNAALETNHTHFIFVDKGSAGWGVEIPFRTEMEDQFLNAKVPVCLIVVQGGPGTFQTVLNAVKKGFPIILVEGSGGAADAICAAYKHNKYIKKQGPPVDISILDRYPAQKKLIDDVILEDEKRKNLTLFNVEDASAEFDTVLLRALLDNQAADLHFKDKLLLAVEWKRVDILQELFDKTTGSPQEDAKSTELILEALDGAFQKALDLDYPDLYTVLLKNGARVANVNLHSLYSNIEVRARLKLMGASSESKKKVQPGSTILPVAQPTQSEDKNEEVYPLTTTSLASFFPPDRPEKITRLGESVLNRLSALKEYKLNLLGERKKGKEDESENSDPSKNGVNYLDLMIWAALAGRTQLCEAIWETAPYPIHSALVVSYIYRTIADFLPDSAAELQDDASKFEDYAMGVLDLFPTFQKAKKGLAYEWSVIGASALRMGVSASCKRFVSHRYCQKVLDQQFFSDDVGKLRAKTPHSMIILMIFFPFLLFIPSFGPFTNPYQLRKPKNQDSKESEGKDHKNSDPNTPPPGFFTVLNFYELPVVKLWTNTLCYIIFLIMLSWLASEPIEHDISTIEMVLGVWISALLVDEIFQFLEDPVQHFEPTSNKLDFSILVAFILYYILRAISASSDDRSIRDSCVDILIPTIVCCYLRLMQVFSINYYLGPLLIMIFKMLKDIIRFFSLFLLFFAGFQISFILITQQAAYHGEAEDDAWKTGYPDGTMGLAYWAFIGEFGDSFDVLNQSDLGVITMAFYLILGQILLQNLLIAMMADTYSEIRDNSDEEWKFSRYLLVHEYKTANLVPPPLNLIELAIHACQALGSVFKEEEEEAPPPPEDEDFVKSMSELRSAFVEEEKKKDQDKVENQVKKLNEQLDWIIQDRAEDKEHLVTIQDATTELVKMMKILVPAPPTAAPAK